MSKKNKKKGKKKTRQTRGRYETNTFKQFLKEEGNHIYCLLSK